MLKNTSGFLRWLFTKNDDYESVALLFQSKVNHNSPRYIPLFLESNKTRVVLFHGLKFPKTDRIMLKLLIMTQKLLAFKFRRYKWCHVMSPRNHIKTNQVLHIDDPIYSMEELQQIRDWITRLRNQSLTGFVVVTNEFTQQYFSSRISDLTVEIIEQGFTQVKSNSTIKKEIFACVYSSPFIDYGKDRHANHSTWSAKILIDSIIPLLLDTDPKIEIHLIGKLGNDARRRIADLPNVVAHGYLNRFENATLMQSCHVAIYPRTVDHLRAVQKIAEYIGAGLPIVTFRLVDTELVTKLNLGISVENPAEFARAILLLKSDAERYGYYKRNVEGVQHAYSWKTLAYKMESIIETL